MQLQEQQQQLEQLLQQAECRHCRPLMSLQMQLSQVPAAVPVAGQAVPAVKILVMQIMLVLQVEAALMVAALVAGLPKEEVVGLRLNSRKQDA